MEVANLSPAELLIGRKICTAVPILLSQMELGWPYLGRRILC